MASAIITPDELASTFATAPAWALVGLTAPVQRLREDARMELAQHVIATLDPPAIRDPRQLALPLA